MMKLLVDKTVIITGCNRGIGKAMLELFASNGCNVVAAVRNLTDDFEKLCSELALSNKVQVVAMKLDIGNKESIKDFIKNVRKVDLKLTGIVNNAGITHNSLFQMSSESDLDDNYNINFKGPFLLNQYVSKLLVRNGGGTVVNISSSAAIDGNCGKSIYGAVKGALISASKSMSRELGEFGIRVNCIAPGVTQTDMLESMSQEVINQTAADTALARVGKPSEIAEVALFLSSDLSSYITGQTIRVDGGM